MLEALRRSSGTTLDRSLPWGGPPAFTRRTSGLAHRPRASSPGRRPLQPAWDRASAAQFLKTGVDRGELGIDGRQPIGKRFLVRRVSLLRRIAPGCDQQLVLVLPFAHHILPLAHEPCQFWRSSGRPRCHLRQRRCRLRALAPLRGQKHLQCRSPRAAVPLRREPMRCLHPGLRNTSFFSPRA